MSIHQFMFTVLKGYTHFSQIYPFRVHTYIGIVKVQVVQLLHHLKMEIGTKCCGAIIAPPLVVGIWTPQRSDAILHITHATNTTAQNMQEFDLQHMMLSCSGNLYSPNWHHYIFHKHIMTDNVIFHIFCGMVPYTIQDQSVKNHLDTT